ncbi:MAG: SUMF1/EgtB/PvdO family nonheme iron enzyme [Myxococcota bacterium]
MAGERQCPACTATLPGDARFCHQCGLRQPQPDEEAPAGSTADTVISGEAVTSPTVSSMAQRRLLPTGLRVGSHYTIGSVLGEGGMGVVYRAFDEVLRRTVAMKALHNNLLGDPGIRRRFHREVDLMRTWIHPNVVQVYDLVETSDLLAFVMEFVDGPTLQQHLSEWGGQMPYEAIRPLFLDILDAVGEAHQQGIIHRDLKPDNILLAHGSTRLHPKIVDFGVAKVIEGTRYTVTGALLGTCRYMSPEQITDPDTVDHRSDIYALGIVLYQMVAGRVPFEQDDQWGTMMAQVRKPPPPLTDFRETVPAPLQSLVSDALTKEPEGRPQSCTEFAQLLTEALSETEEVTPVSPPPPRPPVIEESEGSRMLLVSAGHFKMGPGRRSVFLDAFYMDQYPVTNEQFARFVDVTGYRPTDAEAQRFLAHWRYGTCPPGLQDHPIVFVSRVDALAYCKWVGKRLPTEAEWEKAARGTDGRRYPWGRAKPDAAHANFARRNHGTTDVRAHPRSASPYGVEDLSGNVWEWCQDVYDESFYARGPTHNPRNTVRTKDSAFVLRGGSWFFDEKSLRTYERTARPPLYRASYVGFRCVRSAT